MSRRRHHPQHADRGAALLLAIGFVMMIGMLGASLAAAASSSLNNRTSLETLRNRQYAADGAVERAITVVRALDCSAANDSLVDSTMNGIAIRVEWMLAGCTSVSTSDGSAYAQRNVGFAACLNKNAPCLAADVIVRAQVNFEPANGPVTKTFVQSWSVNR